MAPPRVLIIDDERLIRWSLAETLRGAGYAVQCAASGEEGLALYASFAPDVVLLDFRLPGVNGLAVLRRLLGREPGLPVFIVSAFAEEGLTAQCDEAGARGCIRKPFRIDEVIEAVEAAAGMRRTA